MSKKALSITQFQKLYRTEDDCLDAIVRMRWPKGFTCAKCGHDDGYRLRAKRAIQCAVCRHQTAITAGTIFHGTRIPLLTWFWMIFLVARDKGGASALRLSKQLGMCYSTVWHVLHKIREAMSKRDERCIRLGGAIELDEAFFGGSGRKVQVLVMIEAGRKRLGDLVMKKIFGRIASGPSIEEVINTTIDNQSQQHFVTDCAAAHTIIRKLGHKLVTHKSTPESAAKHLSSVHLVIALARRYLLGTYHGATERKHLQSYLDEFCYRFNRRFKEGQLCESLLRACVYAQPTTYAALTR